MGMINLTHDTELYYLLLYFHLLHKLHKKKRIHTEPQLPQNVYTLCEFLSTKSMIKISNAVEYVQSYNLKGIAKYILHSICI